MRGVGRDFLSSAVSAGRAAGRGTRWPTKRSPDLQMEGKLVVYLRLKCFHSVKESVEIDPILEVLQNQVCRNVMLMRKLSKYKLERPIICTFQI